MHDSSVLSNTTGFGRKRKRSQEPEDQLPQIRKESTQKRLRTSPASRAVANISSPKAENDINNAPHPINHWIQEGSWPKEYFEQDKRLRKYLQQKSAFEEVKHEDWFREQFERSKHEDWFKEEYGQVSNMSHLLARQKSSSSLRRKNSGSGMTTPSDEQPREVKSAKYRSSNYETVLGTKGSFMSKSKLNITDASKDLCRNLLNAKQTVPQDTLFRDDLFDETCESVHGRNEAMVVRDISPLICPSAQVLKIYGAKHLEHLTESVNEGWNSAIPFYDSRPQPDYSVGFGRSAFTNEQLEKLKPFVGEITDSYTSYFMATWRMYFPFLTCEVKCGAAALDIADRQNAHSMTVAVRAIVELFRLMKREKELHREILAFSISHDHSSVRIYGHYAIIDGDKTLFYRHPIKEFYFTSEEGKDKWTAYIFTKNIYDQHKPALWKRICSVIDDLPAGIDFGLSQSASFSQELESQSSQQSNIEPMSLMEEADSQSSLVGSQETTPHTSFTQGPEPDYQRPRNKRAAS